MHTRRYTNIFITLFVTSILLSPMVFSINTLETPPPIKILYEKASMTLVRRGNILQVYTDIMYGIYSQTTEAQTILLPAQVPTASMMIVELNNRTIIPLQTTRTYIAGQCTLPVYKIVLSDLHIGENILRITYHYTANYTAEKATVMFPVSIHRINGQSFPANYSAMVRIAFVNLTNHRITISLSNPKGQELGYTITDIITSPEKVITLSIPVEPYLAGDLVITVTKRISTETLYEVYPSSLVPSIKYDCLAKRLGITLQLTTHYSKYDISDLKHWRVGKDLYISFYFYGYGIASPNETKNIYLHVVFNNILSGYYNIHIIINNNENLTLKYSAICPSATRMPFTEEEVFGGIIAIIVALAAIMAITTHVHRKKTQ